MGRAIVRSLPSAEVMPEGAQPAVTSSKDHDNYVSQIVKLIPTEIVGVYLGIRNLLHTSNPDYNTTFTQLMVFIIILIITPFYLKSVAGITDKRQIWVSIISYCIWCLSLGEPFSYWLNFEGSLLTAERLGGILIMLYTLIVPILYNFKKA